MPTTPGPIYVITDDGTERRIEAEDQAPTLAEIKVLLGQPDAVIEIVHGIWLDRGYSSSSVTLIPVRRIVTAYQVTEHQPD